MKDLPDLNGIITVLNTPFDEDDRIDIESLRKNVASALEAGVVGFLVPAMASEVDKLTTDERRRIVVAVVEENAGQATVIGGASAPNAEQRSNNAKTCIDLGCDGVLVHIPFENEERYEQEARWFDTLNPGLLMLQDWDFQGYGIPVPLIARLFETLPSFRCLKIEVVPAGMKYSQVLEATRGRLHISGGWAVMQMIEALDRGVHAFMPTGMHEIYVRIYTLYKAGKRAAARDLFEQLLPVLAFANQHLDISIHFFKRLLWRQGIYATPRVRKPILPFDSVHEEICSQMIERVEQLR